MGKRGKQDTTKKAYKVRNRHKENQEAYAKLKKNKHSKNRKHHHNSEVRVRDHKLEYAIRKSKNNGVCPSWSKERTEKQKLSRALKRSKEKISNIQTSPPLEKKRRILDQDGQYNSQDMDDVNVRATYASFKVLSEHHKAEGGKKCTLVKRQVFFYNTFFNNHYLFLKININN